MFSIYVDTNADGSIEKSEFQQVLGSNRYVNPNLVKILNDLFKNDANTKVTYERKLLIFLKAKRKYSIYFI